LKKKVLGDENGNGGKKEGSPPHKDSKLEDWSLNGYTQEGKKGINPRPYDQIVEDDLLFNQKHSGLKKERASARNRERK